MLGKILYFLVHGCTFVISANSRKKRDADDAVNVVLGIIKHQKQKRQTSTDTNIHGKRQKHEF